MESVAVSWNSYTQVFHETLAQLLTSEEFTDCTLVCDGGQLKCHKFVLSACSPWFREVLLGIDHPNPVIILQNVNFRELNALLEFVYTGNVTVCEEELQRMVEVGKGLNVTGLADEEKHSYESAATGPTHRNTARVNSVIEAAKKQDSVDLDQSSKFSPTGEDSDARSLTENQLEEPISLSVTVTEPEQDELVTRVRCGARKRKIGHGYEFDAVAAAVFGDFEPTSTFKKTVVTSLGINLQKGRRRGRKPSAQTPRKGVCRKLPSKSPLRPDQWIRAFDSAYLSSSPTHPSHDTGSSCLGHTRQCAKKRASNANVAPDPVVSRLTENEVDSFCEYGSRVGHSTPPSRKKTGPLPNGMTAPKERLRMYLNHDGSVDQNDEYSELLSILRHYSNIGSVQSKSEVEPLCEVMVEEEQFLDPRNLYCHDVIFPLLTKKEDAELDVDSEDGVNPERNRKRRKRMVPTRYSIYETDMTSWINGRSGAQQKDCVNITADESSGTRDFLSLTDDEQLDTKGASPMSKTPRRKYSGSSTASSDPSPETGEENVEAGENKAVHSPKLTGVNNPAAVRGDCHAADEIIADETNEPICQAKASNTADFTRANSKKHHQKRAGPLESPKYKVPLAFGWKRELVQRNTESGSFFDVYYHAPEGLRRKFRSLVEIRENLKSYPSEFYAVENFTFAKGSFSHPNHMMRDAKPRSRKIRKQAKGNGSNVIYESTNGACKIELVDVFASFQK